MNAATVSNARVTLSLDALAGGTIFAFRLVERIGAPFEVGVGLRLPLPLPTAASLLGAELGVTMADRSGSRTVTGVIASVSTRTSDEGVGDVEIVVRPRTHLLELGRASRSWQERSPVDVLTEVLAPASPPRLALTRSYPSVPYRVQRSEDDWSFVVRTLAAEGITYWFDHDDASRLVLVDDTRTSPSIEGLSILPHYSAGLDELSEAVVSLGTRGAVTTSAVVRKSFSWRNPALALAAGPSGGRYEAYDAPGGGPATPETLARVTSDATDAARAGASTCAGEARTARLYPGRSFRIGTTIAPEGPWLVTSSSVALDGTHSFLTTFEAVSRDVPVRPSTSGPRGAAPPAGAGQAGLSFGVVIADAGDEVLPDDAGRVRVQMHWDRGGARDAKSGTWMRVAQRGAPGSMMFPRVGWFVATQNEEGGVDGPSVLSRIHDGERPPEYELPANKTRVVFKTATSPGGGNHNEIHFEDAKGRQNLFWHASRDEHVVVKRVHSERIDNDAWHEVGRDQTVRVGASRTEEVRIDRSESVGKDRKTDIGAQSSERVSRDESVVIGGSRRLKAGDAHGLSVEGSRTLKVGAALVDVSLGQISATAKAVVELVGGVFARLTAKSYTEDASDASIELVGAVKAELAGANRSIGVGDALVDTVGGSVLIDAGKRWIDSAQETSTWTVAGAVNGTTQELQLEGYTSIELRCGDSVVLLEPEKISLQGKTLQLDGKELEAVTAVIEHNG